MKLLDLKQGSDEWISSRLKGRAASEAPVMMGASGYMKRNELLHIKKTGTPREYSDWVQKNLFDKGHDIEAKARALAEEVIGEPLFPVVAAADDGYLTVSFDGLTMAEDVSWENKMWNAEKVAEVRAGNVPACDFWQVVQQASVTKGKVLYTVTDGTPENFVYVWYEYNPEDEARLRAGWAQFDADLEAYVPKAPEVQLVGRTPDSIPAIYVEVEGKIITKDNLAEFRAATQQLIAGIKTDLKTDQDFADAEATVKWLKEKEELIDVKIQDVLSKAGTLNDLISTLRDVQENVLRVTRLNLDKKVEANKKQRRLDIQQAAEADFAAHIAAINERLRPVTLPAVPINIPAAMKGKRSFDSMQNAVDTEVARAKVEATLLADKIAGNLTVLESLAKDYKFLFADLQSIVNKPVEDFTALVTLRVQQHEAELAEKQRREEEARKAREERERLAREAEEQRKAEDAERLKQHEQEQKKSPEAAKVRATVQAANTTAGTTGDLLDAVKPARPTDRQILDVLTQHYRVHDSVVVSWLLEMDLEQLGNELAFEA